MKRINLIKHGFMRAADLDFDDDGAKFTCYRFVDGSDSYVSKTTYKGKVFLSAQVDGDLPYEVYSKLPNYNAANWKYNGVSIEDLTEDDLRDFYTACVNHEKEYRETEASINYPTIEELTERCEQLQTKAILEYAEAQKIVMDAILLNKFIKLSDYQVREVKNDLARLKAATEAYDPKTYPQHIYKTACSFNMMKPDFNDLMQENYWLRSIKDVFVNL